MSQIQFPVLISGAGPTGLSAALFLARQGIRSLVVEKHPTTSVHPRARGLNVRTMELYRVAGLSEQIRAAGLALAKSRYMLFVESLRGKEIRRILDDELVAGGELLARYSPEDNCQCAQDELEPILLRAARSYGVEVRFNTTLTRFTQDEVGLTATLSDLSRNEEYTVQASYLIGADGADSSVRHQLGFDMNGLDERATENGGGPLGYFVNIYFKLDLTKLVEDRWFGICFIENPELDGLFLPVNNRDRWLLNVRYSPQKGENPADFTPERCRELIRIATGLEEVEPEIISILPWEGTARQTNRMQAGRVFLAGDAAHLMPPAGAFGLNTGVQDAHNLAWKLARVLGETSKPALLETYELERWPVAHSVINQAVREMQTASPDAPAGPPGGWGIGNDNSNEGNDEETGEPPWGGPGGDETLLYQLATMLGYRYASSAIITENKVETDDGLLVLDGRTGSRAPHYWLQRPGPGSGLEPGETERISTLDLFEKNYVLLTTSPYWREVVEASEWNDKSLVIYLIGSNGDLVDPQGNFTEVYGLGSGGATLVRPDGFVAFRTIKEPTEGGALQNLQNIFEGV